jgi:hypothetical protein
MERRGRISGTRAWVAIFVVIATVCALGLATTGCGGGGAAAGEPAALVGSTLDLGAAPTAAAATGPDPASGSTVNVAVALTPNYVSDLAALRHWPTTTWTVCIDGPWPGQDAAEHARKVARLQQGFALWSNALASFRFVYTNDSNADIRVTLVPRAHFEATPSMVGQAVVSLRGDNVLSRAEIAIDETRGDEELVQIAAHEMGHALGLDGHSGNQSDLMCPYLHLPAALTVSDQNTLRLAYADVVASGGRAQSSAPSNTGGTITIACPLR